MARDAGAIVNGGEDGGVCFGGSRDCEPQWSKWLTNW